MKLSQLLTILQHEIIEQGGSGDPHVDDIRYDSRKVKKGTVYVSIPGTIKHGDTFIHDALKNGAVAVISENIHPELNVPWIQVREIRKVPGLLGKKLWNVDINKVNTVGVTGTNGKTTVTHLFETLYKYRYEHSAVWMFGTIDYHIGSLVQHATNTTPEALDIFRFTGEVAQQPSAIVMEVSSHSIALDRVSGLLYDCAVWTNLTQDHLDFHKDMESYYFAKRRLFTEYLKHDGKAVINIDDPWGRRLVDDLKGVSITTYGAAENADVRFKKWKCDWNGTSIELETKQKTFSVESKLCGFFNVYNITALIAGGIAEGFSIDEITESLKSINTVPGRMDRVELDAPFAVVIDYSHTPDALVNILKTSRTLTEGKLICVFGCGGDRDKTKRPIMGAAVAKYADDGIVTSDNPRSENPSRIIEEILGGIPLDFPHRSIVDRREAIRCALQSAERNDCVVIAGKGHENYQEIMGIRNHFDDKEVVIEEYARLKGNSK